MSRQQVIGESPYPHDMPATVIDAEAKESLRYMTRLQAQMNKSMDDIAQFYVDQTNRVDEYRPQSLSGENLTTESLLSDYECDEVITSFLITGPTNQPDPELVSVSAHGSVTTPAAGQSLATINANQLVVGQQYQVVAYVYYNGTPASPTDDDNVRIEFNGSSLGTVPINGAAGTTPVTFTAPITAEANGVNSIQAQAIGLATTGAIYHVTLMATPITPQGAGTPFTLQLGRRSWELLLPPTGILAVGPVQFKLGRSDVRQLIASVAGNWSFELMGYADTGRRGRV